MLGFRVHIQNYPRQKDQQNYTRFLCCQALHLEARRRKDWRKRVAKNRPLISNVLHLLLKIIKEAKKGMETLVHRKSLLDYAFCSTFLWWKSKCQRLVLSWTRFRSDDLKNWYKIVLPQFSKFGSRRRIFLELRKLE